MEKRSLISETIDLWLEDRRAGWENPSWWNLLVLWPIPFVLFYCIHTSVRDLQIARRQITTVATIDTHDPATHDRYGFVFKIGEAQYTGWAYPSDKRAYVIGEGAVVYYDPLEPAKNSTDDFRSVSNGDLFFVPFCVIVLIGLPAFIYIRRRAWKHRVNALSNKPVLPA